MTREEAVTVLKAFMENPLFSGVHKQAFNMAIKALEQEPCEDCISRRATLEKFKKTYFDNATVIRCAELVLGGMPSVTPKRNDALDEIRAEIEALPKTYPFVNHIDTYVKEDDVLQIIDKYKGVKE